MHDGVIKIRIAAPAVENAANEAMIDFVAEAIGVSERSVRIVYSARCASPLANAQGRPFERSTTLRVVVREGLADGRCWQLMA
jgi:hypothetical protein